MYLILFVFIGLATGVLARLMARNKRAGLPVVSTTIGIVGALGGGLLGRSIGFHGDATELAGLLLSIAGAVGLVMTYHSFARPRASA
jgi:uncharacterized membrane protein YeaQ/YmgE (transglycosylase-associated protein family)